MLRNSRRSGLVNLCCSVLECGEGPQWAVCRLGITANLNKHRIRYGILCGMFLFLWYFIALLQSVTLIIMRTISPPYPNIMLISRKLTQSAGFALTETYQNTARNNPSKARAEHPASIKLIILTSHSGVASTPRSAMRR